ncbi:hypothetical protein B0I35DRAFT_38939 [Stachybotrys elegans]|uniref:DUF3074 domain-containing protein n=1 Tax=Stachybotrys elegans TaxID=80388 RepID=A0A8K0WXG3_9HYPO|nr:hypothetical protein B0I35DRAFT_38939 [Stachybotrys elegans]
MTTHHEAFKALGPIDWDQVPTDGLGPFLQGVFRDAQTIVESVPSPASATAAATTQRARARTDSAIDVGDLTISPATRLSPEASSQASQLQKDWKEVKVNPKDNPLGINVYKLASKDGNGAWFARRSIHEAPSFDIWKLGLEKELAETLKSRKPLGSGNIRGIGAEKRVEHREIPETGYLDVYQLYAQFPGPTSPRDFVTLLLGSDDSSNKQGSPQPLRQFMIVSRPCNHPKTPPRQGIIRGQYESIELVREIPADKFSPKRSMSYNNLTGEGGKRIPGASDITNDNPPTVVEWLMVTRSDPGGSVPRFMIERGTPPGIINDAGKFLKWLSSKNLDAFSKAGTDVDSQSVASLHDDQENPEMAQTSANRDDEPPEYDDSQPSADDTFMSNSGLYAMITGAFGAATSMATGFRKQFTAPLSADGSQNSTNAPTVQEDSGDDSLSDVSSLRTFASALEKGPDDDKKPESVDGSRSDETKSLSNSHEDKELKRLEERRRRLEEKTSKMQERMEQKRQEGRAKDEASLAKAREKHEKELAKQEAKYQRELKRLEEKRENERRKTEERKRKAAEREERSNLTLELEKVRAERDLALQEIKLLQGQVGDLQAQNTRLVASLGRLEASASSSSQDLLGTPRRGPPSTAS